jgi:hypothetical protein
MLGKGQRARERRRDRIRTCREWSSCSVTKPIAGLLVAVSRSWARIPGFSRTVKASNRITRRGRRRGQLTRVASACVWLRQPARGSSRRGQTGAPRPADLRELAHAEVPETAVSLAPGSRQRRRSDLRPAVNGGREAKAEEREARAKDKVFNAFTRWRLWSAPVTGGCGGFAERIGISTRVVNGECVGNISSDGWPV